MTKIQKIINNVLTNRISIILSFFLATLSSIMIMVCSPFTSGGKKEASIREVVELANTTKSKNISYFIESIDSSQKISNWRPFCTSKNNSFYETEPFQYFVTYNAKKNHEIYAPDLDEYGLGLSFITSGVFSIHSFKGKNILDAAYLETYYSDSNTSFVGNYDNFTYISDTQARYLRDVKWKLPHTSDNDFQCVINKELIINIDGNDYKWKIANVYFDNSRLCDVAHDLIGEFMFSYTYLPNHQTDPFEIVATFPNNDFFAKEKLTEIQKSFPNKQYDKELNTNNINVDDAAIKRFDSFISKEYTTSNGRLVPCLIFAYLLLSFSVVLFVFNKTSSPKYLFFVIPGIQLSVWLIFKIVSLLYTAFSMFSSFSSLLIAINIIILLTTLLVLRKRKNEDAQ